IPLPDLMRRLREEQWRRRLVARPYRLALGIWAALAKRPRLYRLLSRAGVRILELLAGRRGRIVTLPGAAGWTRYRDLTAPQAGTFMDQYKQGRRR
ncbi:MAG: lactate utilization protein LutB domain-containing protein, partial [Hyphomicrobiaceae bacterium]